MHFKYFYCPNCREKVQTQEHEGARFPFCTKCNIQTRRRPPRRPDERVEIQLTAKGAAMMLLYENTKTKLQPQPENDAFFQIMAGLMQNALLTELNRFADTPQHGTTNRRRT